MRSLAHRIGLGYVLATAVIVAVGAFAAIQFADLGGSVGRILEENYRSVLAAENMMEELERQEDLLRRARSGETASQTALDAHRRSFQRWFAEAERGAALPEEPALLDSIAQAYATFNAAADALLAPGVGASSRDEEAAVEAEAIRLRSLNLRLLDVNQSAMLATQARVEREARAATWTVLVAAGLAAVGSLLAALAFAGSVTRPLRLLTESVRRVRRGHLGERVPVTTDDEVGELGRAFNQMTERLAAYEALNVQALTAERDRAETERRKATSLVEAMPSPVVVTDSDDRVMLLNHAAHRLLRADVAPDGAAPEWEGHPLAEVAPELARHLDEHEASDDSLVHLTLGGSPAAFRLRRTVVRSAEGVALRIVLLEDVTPFQALDRARRDFVATVSHELRTPLTSLGVALDLLLKDLVGPLAPAQRDLVETAKADQDRLKRLVADLVTLARLEAGETAAAEPVDLAAIAETALDGLRLPAQERGVRLAASFGDAPLVVRGDARQLGWMVTNLVANAIRHAPEGSVVAVRGQTEGEAVRIEVEDAGPGVPADAAERIFEPFVQVDVGEHRAGSAGLGLAIVRRAVEAHGGRVWAESIPGRGLFILTLPLNPAG